MALAEINDIQSKIRKYHSLSEAILLDRRTIGYPYYFVSIDLTYISSRTLELQEEFVLKCIYQGLRTRQEISSFLGINEKFVERILSSLIFRELLTLDQSFQLTKAGLEALERQTVLATVSENFTFYLDALSGKIPNVFSIKKIERENCIALKRIIQKPKLVEDLVDYYEEIQGILRFQQKQDRLELLQINRVEKVYAQWHEIDLMLYKASPDDTEINYEVFSRDSIATEYRDAIDRLYAKGEKILDSVLHFDMEPKGRVDNSDTDDLFKININKNDVLEIEKLSVKLTSLEENDSFSEAGNSSKEKKNEIRQQLEEYKTKTNILNIVHTLEHRDYLFKALQDSQKRLMIVSPWIRSSVVDSNFLRLLEFTLKRNISVYILYGIKQRPGFGQQNDSSAIRSLDKLAKSYQNFHFAEVKNTHRKIVVCDDLFAIVTSFNFLSFRADPILTYRDELGVVLRDEKTIKDLFESGLALLKL